MVAAGVGASTIGGLAIPTAIRSRSRNRRLVFANLSIATGVLATGEGGEGLALGESSRFAVSLVWWPH